MHSVMYVICRSSLYVQNLPCCLGEAPLYKEWVLKAWWVQKRFLRTLMLTSVPRLSHTNPPWMSLEQTGIELAFVDTKTCITFQKTKAAIGVLEVWTVLQSWSELFFNNLDTLTLGLPGLTLKNWSTFKKRGEERRSQVEKEHINTINICKPHPYFKEGIEWYVDCGTSNDRKINNNSQVWYLRCPWPCCASIDK